MSSTQSKCYKGDITVVKNRQCQCNIEGKTCEWNSSSFSCIEMYSVKDDQLALFHSASWGWQTACVALASGAMLSYYWRSVVSVEGVGGGGVRGFEWYFKYGKTELVQINRTSKVPRRNHGPSLAVVLGCSGPPESYSLHFVGQQLYTPHSATGNGIHDLVWPECFPGLPRPLTLRALNVWSHLKWNITANSINDDMTRYLQEGWHFMAQCWL